MIQAILPTEGASRRSLIRFGAAAALVLVARTPGASAGQTEAAGTPAVSAPIDIQALLDEAAKRTSGTVRLPPGRHVLSVAQNNAALVVPANVRLEGAGRDVTTLVMAEGTQGHAIVAPYGWAQIADLTIDGNEAGRPGAVGHNLRITGDHLVVERVRSINSVSYGLAIGQRRFASNVVVRDVEIVNAGTDGIDIKNDLNKTENILIENVTIRGFGRPKPGLAADRLLTKDGDRRNKAGIDLRGRCEVRNVAIYDVPHDCDGLRFRNGEVGEGHGPGAHGSVASGVFVRGVPGQRGTKSVSIVARDVVLNDIDVGDTEIGIMIYADGAAVKRGLIARSSRAAVLSREIAFAKPRTFALEDIRFEGGDALDLQDVADVRLVRCTFSTCRSSMMSVLQGTRGLSLSECIFDDSCRA